VKTIKRILLIIAAFILISAFPAVACGAHAVFSEPASEGVGAGVQIPAELIYQQSADAVFLLEMYDINGELIRTGSGFFISEMGLGVTNLHVIQNAASASIILNNGDEYPVRGVHAVSEEHNLCIFSIDSDEVGWDYLSLANSDNIESGNSVYAIGSPMGYINTMTGGIISNTQRDAEGERFIQFTAPISFGSGGSPLLNSLGQVIGVASSSFSYGQNLNLAVPINHVKAMHPGECVPLSKLLR